MVMAAYDGLGGQDVKAAAHVGAAFEMLHTALIVHDDVIDRDFTRRGGPNVSGAYRDIATTQGLPQPLAEHRGMSAAVIAGDLALVNAYRLIDASGVRDLTRSHLMEILDDAVFASAAGELIDVEFSLTADVPSVEEILRMERLKTAVYSFEAPLQAGAVLAGARPEVVAALGFGKATQSADVASGHVLVIAGKDAPSPSGLRAASPAFSVGAAPLVPAAGSPIGAPAVAAAGAVPDSIDGVACIN
jgi:geranylgeranyl diphosphate synthase type II